MDRTGGRGKHLAGRITWQLSEDREPNLHLSYPTLKKEVFFMKGGKGTECTHNVSDVINLACLIEGNESACFLSVCEIGLKGKNVLYLLAEGADETNHTEKFILHRSEAPGCS